MTPEQRVEQALKAAQPGSALRGLVEDLVREGLDKEAVVELLERILVLHRNRSDSRQLDEEAILDALDALHGWCHPTAQVLPG